MENSNVKENLEVLFEKFKNMIKVETVKVTASNCSTLRATLTAAALIVLSVWCLISCPN